VWKVVKDKVDKARISETERKEAEERV